MFNVSCYLSDQWLVACDKLYELVKNNAVSRIIQASINLIEVNQNTRLCLWLP